MMQIFSLFSVTLFVIFSATHRVLCVDTCEPASCGSTGPIVRFPFRLDRHPERCGYPGFDLSCNNRSQVVLNLPSVGDIVVNDINYLSQTIYLKPDFCLLDRTQYFYTSGSGTPFSFGSFVDYSFFNCSSLPFFPGIEPFDVLDCESSANNTVVAVPTRFFNGFSDQGSSEVCQRIRADLVPVGFVWDTPFCGRCESINGTCGYKNVETQEVGCSISSKNGLSTTAKYGILVGAGLPALFLLACLAIYARKKMNDRALLQHQHRVQNLPTRTITPQTPRFVLGLDKLTIDSNLPEGSFRRAATPMSLSSSSASLFSN
ncbi:RING-H2 finger protein ATL22 [Heracleum sosnowskyi]|uniref:RING-type E3 ubiquitin transferase n=1 Tax=Heracleum sosnowskyi TaxID=360622 RepID=A0AAD8IA62_9APIA|nr:RING-H2 finger protein ATL22 [Heracleum sosnowskyi]